MKKLFATTTLVFATAIAIASAGSVWFAGADTALAPEPARLTQPLSGSNGATGAAYYVNTTIETTVVRWSGSWMYNTSLAAGTPCSTVDLAAGVETGKVIQATGNYRKCA